MKKYVELKYTRAVGNGKRFWVDGKPTGRVSTMDNKTVEQLNSQFEVSGIQWAEDTPSNEELKQLEIDKEKLFAGESIKGIPSLVEGGSCGEGIQLPALGSISDSFVRDVETAVKNGDYDLNNPSGPLPPAAGTYENQNSKNENPC
jgi:hypothetical protein